MVPGWLPYPITSWGDFADGWWRLPMFATNGNIRQYLPHVACFLPPRIDVRLDDVYDIGHELGTGSFSVVHLGRHRSTGEDVRNLLPTQLTCLLWRWRHDAFDDFYLSTRSFDSAISIASPGCMYHPNRRHACEKDDWFPLAICGTPVGCVCVVCLCTGSHQNYIFLKIWLQQTSAGSYPRWGGGYEGEAFCFSNECHVERMSRGTRTMVEGVRVWVKGYWMR